MSRLQVTATDVSVFMSKLALTAEAWRARMRMRGLGGGSVRAKGGSLAAAVGSGCNGCVVVMNGNLPVTLTTTTMTVAARLYLWEPVRALCPPPSPARGPHPHNEVQAMPAGGMFGFN